MLSARDALMLAPVAVAAAIAWILGRFSNRESIERHSVSAAIGLAFCAGFFVIHEWTDAIPSRHRHWMLQVAIMAAVIGPVLAAQGVATWERILVAIAAASAAAFALVPTWEELFPTRMVWVPVLAGYLAVLGVFIEPLASRVSPRVVLLSMFASAFTLAGLVTAIWSVTLGKLTVLPALAMLGVGLVTWFAPAANGTRGAALAYGLLVGGAGFLACVDPPPPSPPVWELLAIPVAPIVLWLCAAGPLSRPLPRKLLYGGLLLPAIYLAAIAAWIVVKHGALDEGI
jgi:hypothetical protein